MKEIVIEIRCIGCNKLTTPKTIDWELFRLGVHAHHNDECLTKANDRLERHNGVR